MKLVLSPKNLEQLLDPQKRDAESERARRETLRRARELGQHLVIVEPPKSAPLASD